MVSRLGAVGLWGRWVFYFALGCDLAVADSRFVGRWCLLLAVGFVGVGVVFGFRWAGMFVRMVIVGLWG